MKMYCDGQTSINMTKLPHDRIKHVEINCHFIKEKIEGGII